MSQRTNYLKTLIKWPRGRYNGKKIVGIEFSFRGVLTMWQWRPKYYRWERTLVWGCVIVHFGFEYES